MVAFFQTTTTNPISGLLHLSPALIYDSPSRLHEHSNIDWYMLGMSDGAYSCPPARERALGLYEMVDKIFGHAEDSIIKDAFDSEICDNSNDFYNLAYELSRYLKVCQIWRSVAESKLYSSVHIDLVRCFGRKSESKITIKQAEHLLRTLQENRGLSFLVRRIHLYSLKRDLKIEKMSLIVDIIRRCDNLQHFQTPLDKAGCLKDFQGVLAEKLNLQAVITPKPMPFCHSLCDPMTLLIMIEEWPEIRQVIATNFIASSSAPVNFSRVRWAEKFELQELWFDCLDATFIRRFSVAWKRPLAHLCGCIKNEIDAFWAMNDCISRFSSQIKILGIRLERHQTPVYPGFFSDAMINLGGLEVLITDSTLVTPSALKNLTSLRLLVYVFKHEEDLITFASLFYSHTTRRGSPFLPKGSELCYTEKWGWKCGSADALIRECCKKNNMRINSGLYR